MKQHKFTKEQIDFLRREAPGKKGTEILGLFNTAFNASLTISKLKNAQMRYRANSGIRGGQFRKGHSPTNKGQKWHEYMSAAAQEKSRKTQFKKGQPIWNHRPVGSERICSKDGYILIKIEEPKKWRAKHLVIWEKANGPIPKKHVVIFADGNKLNIALDNLILISQAENARLNQIKLRHTDPEITKSGVMLARLLTQIGKKSNGGGHRRIT
jgi:hypothetical protein